MGAKEETSGHKMYRELYIWDQLRRQKVEMDIQGDFAMNR